MIGWQFILCFFLFWAIVQDNEKVAERSGSSRMESFQLSTSVPLHKKDAEMMRRTFLIAVLITGFFIVSWFPVLAIQHWFLWWNVPIFRKIVFLNSVVNPVIYYKTNKDFRDQVKHRFGD